MPKIEQLEPTLAELQGWDDDREMSPTDDEDDSDAEYSGGGSSATLGTSPAPPSPLVKVEDDYSTVIDLTQDGEDERAEQLALAQEEGPGVQLQPVKKEEDEDVKTFCSPRRSCGRDGNAPAPQTPAAPDIITDGTEAKPFAKESDIKDYAKMVTAYYNFVEPPRPAGLGTFDIPSWTPFEVANEPEVDELRADSHFKRKDLRGMEQGTIHRSHTDGRRKYGTTRLCCMEWLNIGTMQPGAPFMWFASADEWLDRDLTKNRFALFVQPTEQKCWWRYLGMYEMVWAGKPRDGEFSALPEADKRRIVQAYDGYVQQNITFAHVIFGLCTLSDNSDTHILADLGVGQDPESKAKLEQRRRRVRQLLERNDRKLRLIFVFMRWIGLDRTELEDCRARRREREQETQHKQAGKRQTTQRTPGRAAKRNRAG
ncbi:uncharacterized protein JCM10292_002898 [Rhodotorula paludigena]|uniref:uncharacterized protein n=1 Tax=Rhodotorula paludigena TaxID=86838 RepID=UPI003170F55C